MGLGDEIMVTGEARRVHESGDTRPVVVLDRHGRPRWHPLWQANPRIAPPGANAAGQRVQTIINGPGCRPYVDYARMAAEFAALFPRRAFATKVRDPRLPWRYTGWRCAPGELACVDPIAARGYVVIEPHVKANASPNKAWPWARWQALVHSLRWARHPYVQLGPRGTRRLAGVAFIETPTFPDAARALSGAAALITTEGGLHHAAAALGVPAIVIFGGMTSPANTGYAAHVNLFEPMDGASPCGQRVPCAHCRAAMARITVERVAHHLEHVLNARTA